MPPPTPKEEALLARQAEIHAELQDILGRASRETRDNDHSHSSGNANDADAAAQPVGPRSLAPPVPAKHKRGQAVSVAELPPVPRTRTDVHWDYVCKEMQWLATDFGAERKRHASQRRRVAHAVTQHFGRQAARAQAALAQAHVRRRKLASKLSRDVKGWWSKLEKVITYRQKVVYDKSRQKAMNRQLVTLVRQTERYTESLASTSSQRLQQSPVGSSRRGSRRRSNLTIEEALATTSRTRRVYDYAHLAQQQEQDLQSAATSEDDEASMIYGVSLLDASDEDSSYAPSSDMTDDETTLREAELAEWRQAPTDSSAVSATSTGFQANPVELLKLQQEQEMDIMEVLERLQQEGTEEQLPAMSGSSDRPRRVQFAETDPGADADDDGDASDVEDYRIADYAGEEENDDDFYPSGPPAVDDESTMAAEEALPQELTPAQELQLLHDEQEISVEELRQRYMAALGGEPPPDEEEESVDAVGDDNPVDDEDFEPVRGEDVDDETTIAAEEKLGRDISYEEEIDLLQREGEMSLEDLRALYQVMSHDTAVTVDAESKSREDDQKQSANSSSSLLLETSIQEDEGDQDDFVPTAGMDVDDETTIDAEERLGREMSYEDEIALLQKENEMSVDELRSMYAGMDTQSVEFSADTSTDDHEDNYSSKPRMVRGQRKKRERTVDDPDRINSVLKKPRTGHGEASDTEAALAALEASAEKARTTLASRPFLLSDWVKLREYQQVGLNWLVSLHGRRLNGILADEMGLGKTLQTIALLGYLAAYKGIWGPHLVVVPTSVILNWETELKRFCPAFKVLCYYGTAKRRKELRTGWTKTNVYHVVITSYQLVVQDAFAFKRKRWYYLVLDEAQNIKNFQSQRWQTLIGFNTQRRLLLSGTPLQNTLMELWSLLHFLMPYIFRSRKEFSYWFANPMSSMIEGNSEQNSDVVQRLHGILRPFVLRRLKKDVETQMPGKFEHVIKCQLSRRQMYLYEEFMARSSTRQALKSGTGSFMAMMNVLMQLRKVCNHPDLFEPRSIITPFVLDPVSIIFPQDVYVSRSAHDHISQRILSPLWCGSTGQPSMDRAVAHDIVEHTHLRELYEDMVELGPLEDDHGSIDINDDDALRDLLRNIYKARQERRLKTIAFHSQLNKLRCETTCFPYSNILQRTLKVPGRFKDRCDLNVLNTPSDLLALRRTHLQRANEVDHLVKRFVFCVPRAGVKAEGASPLQKQGAFYDALLSPVEEYLKPFRTVQARLSSFFPDKRLIQFDAGKLQTLAELLRELKRGGHKTLIFTQMSKMLDILEAFLNLNGHTYLRLDGSTGVERRQRLMDRFNSDPKIFCFILSTRSGGLGINLTGADTVIFYDTDWNPAMDAQAQDRAHRIGQTREVHVYRLVTEQTIEENILLKAKQKRNLDILVMDKGRFDSSHLFRSGDEARMITPDTSSKDVYTKSGLQSILGLSTQDRGEEPRNGTDLVECNEKDMTTQQMETAMTELEDADDVNALRGAQKEAAEDLKEFDESLEIKADNEEDDDERNLQDAEENKKRDETAERAALEREFASWQTEVGMDNEAIEASLSPIERYGLHVREDLDPFYSLYAVLEYNRKMDEKEEADNEIDIEKIEAEKAADERNAVLDGDLLVTDPLPEDLVRQRKAFQRERARLKADVKRRQMTGENWEVRIDEQHDASYWYNVDTGEARWDKPRVLLELEMFSRASEIGWKALPSIVSVMSFLSPFPERSTAALVCKHWHKAASDFSFVRHVYPVEMGASTRSNMHPNHFRSLADAVETASCGDSIEFSDGHYWLNHDLTIRFPLRLVGDENNPSNVVIEMNNGCSVKWKGEGGWIEGITFRRPQIASASAVTKPVLQVEPGGRLHMYQCTVDNEGSASRAAIDVLHGGSLKLTRVSVRSGNVQRQ